MKRLKINSFATKITLGFVFTIFFLGIVIFICCEYYSINAAKNNYKQLTESCARSAAYSLFNMPVEKYLKEGKNGEYYEQLATLVSICRHFGLKYLYVYVPDFSKNQLTTIFYVDGKTDRNLKGRELGTVIDWQITQLEKDTFDGKDTKDVYITNNYMGHTISSYATVYNLDDKPVALVGADLDFEVVKNKILQNIMTTVFFLTVCLVLIYTVLIIFLKKMFIKPVMKISLRMANFAKDSGKDFKPLKVKTDDEIGLMAKSFNKMVFDINSYIKKITDTQMETIFSLAKLAQSRDDDTGKHLERVQQYCKVLSEQLFVNSPYSHQIDKSFIENIFHASPLHDIGKVGISDTVLLKHGKLSDEEYEKIKKHTIIGYETLQEVHQKFGSNSFIEMGMVMALFHHERFDGNGYPMGLSGEEIPLAARIMALSDVYDALSTKRIYKPAFDNDKCVEIIKEQSGKLFDPIIVEAFLEIQDRFFEIRKSMED